MPLHFIDTRHLQAALTYVSVCKQQHRRQLMDHQTRTGKVAEELDLIYLIAKTIDTHNKPYKIHVLHVSVGLKIATKATTAHQNLFSCYGRH